MAARIGGLIESRPNPESEALTRPPAALTLGLWLPLAAVVLLIGARLAGLDFGSLNWYVERWADLLLEAGAALACLLRAALVRRERNAWALIGAAAAIWVVADLLWRTGYHGVTADLTAVSDALWIAYFPLTYGGIVLLIRDRARQVGAEIWVDGAIAALAVGAVVTATSFGAVVNGDGGSDAAANVAVVIGDVILLGLVLFALALGGWRLDRAWAWLGGAMAIFAVSDSVFAAQSATGSYELGGPVDAGWPVALTMLAIAAWQSAPARFAPAAPRLPGRRSIVLPLSFGVVALGVMVYDHFTQVTTLALVLATICLLAVFGRLLLTYGENVRMLRAIKAQAETDALTGLPNRRRLVPDIERAIVRARRHDECLLLILDLDRFKEFNDRFGHPEGDALLARLGARLELALRPWGRAYRLGGDEFCALLRPRGEPPERLAAIAKEALSESRGGIEVGSSAGWAVLPAEASGSSAALRLADRRMYEDKAGRRGAASAPAKLNRRSTRARSGAT